MPKRSQSVSSRIPRIRNVPLLGSCCQADSFRPSSALTFTAAIASAPMFCPPDGMGHVEPINGFDVPGHSSETMSLMGQANAVDGVLDGYIRSTDDAPLLESLRTVGKRSRRPIGIAVKGCLANARR